MATARNWGPVGPGGSTPETEEEILVTRLPAFVVQLSKPLLSATNKRPESSWPAMPLTEPKFACAFKSGMTRNLKLFVENMSRGSSE